MTTKRRRLRRAAVLFGAILVAAACGAAYPVVAKGGAWLTARWEHPLALVALAIVPFVLYRATLGEDPRRPRLRLGTALPLMGGPTGARVWLRDVPGVLRAVALSLLVLAAARPVSSFSPDTSDEEGIDAVLVLDLSGS